MMKILDEKYGDDFGVLVLVKLDENSYHWVAFYFENEITIELYDSYADTFYEK